MPESLSTPFVHRLIESPVGYLFHLSLYERVKTAYLDREFATARARAAADISLAEGPNRFIDHLGIQGYADDEMRANIRNALEVHRERRQRLDDVNEEWNAVFWDDDSSSPDERVRIEKRRRKTATEWAQPTRQFKFLTKRRILDPVGFDVPPPDEVLEGWGPASVDATDHYAPPRTSPDIERSATVRGPETREFIVRFPSPSAHLDDTAYARVYEPADGDGDPLPTLIFGSGLGMMNDQLTYWPEEEYVGRELAPEGYRIVLPESPWSGRREQPGYYSGEPYLRRAPVSVITLYGAQSQETAVLVDWARSLGAPAVGVGGMSLGGIVAMFVAGHADSWPQAMRPDALFPVAMSARIGRLLTTSSLTEVLGVRDALTDAGWSLGKLERLDHLLVPPETPGIDPEHIYPFGGLDDQMTDYPTTREFLDTWEVPQRNRTEWECGHFGVLLRAMRDEGFRLKIAERLSSYA